MALLYLGGLAFVIGAVAAFLVASPARRGWWLVAAGALLTLAYFVLAWSQASNGRDARGCHDCEMFLGRYWQWYLVLFLGLVNWAGWSLGVAVGTGLRAAFAARRGLREQRQAG